MIFFFILEIVILEITQRTKEKVDLIGTVNIRLRKLMMRSTQDISGIKVVYYKSGVVKANRKGM